MENENTIKNTAEPYIEEKAPEVSFRDAAFALCAFGLGFVFTHFCMRYPFGLWDGILRSAFGILTAVFAGTKGVRFTVSQRVMFAAAELFCLTPFFCANRDICFLSSVFSFVLFLYLITCVSGADSFGRHFVRDLFLSVLVRPFANFTRLPVCVFTVIKNGKNKHSKNALYALLGLLLAVPLTVVVAELLISSDEVFGDMVNGFLENLPVFSSSRLFWELLFALPIAMYLFGAQCSMEDNNDGYRNEAEAAAPEYRFMPPVSVYFAVSPICLFYLIYIIVQCGNIAGVLGGSDSVRYSDFARQGFFELCAIAVINLGVITLALTFSKRQEGDVKPPALRVYAIMLSAFTLMIIATALIKMFMYIGEFGMTQLRVYTSWFMILLAFAFTVILISQIKEFIVWKTLFAGFVLMFAVLCFGNFDGNIAAYNINAYRAGTMPELDVNMFNALGYAAVPPAAELFSECNDDSLRSDLEDFLQDQRMRDLTEDGFAYFSLPRILAEKKLKKS